MEMKQIITGKTIDEAKANAVAQLGLDADGFSYQVVQMPKSGFLGIGAQPAKIEVTFEAPDPKPEAPKVALSAASRSKPKAPKKPEPKAEPAPQPKAEPKPAPVAPVQQVKESTPKAEQPERTPRENREPRKPQAPKPPQPKAEPKQYTPAEPGSLEEKIEQFISGLLERMDSKAVPHCWKEEGNTYQVDLVGEDLGYLIGRRGDTLDAIQHLTNYAINRGVEGHIRVNVDAESYREKREESLRRYAVKKAQQVLKMRRRTTLEPMNAYERHVIHAALQDMENITTHSTGVEPNRRVVIEYVR